MKKVNQLNRSAFLSIIGLLAMVLSASYAYFSSSNNAQLTYNTAVGGGASFVYTLTMKNNLVLQVDPHVLSQGGTSNVTSTVSTDTVTLTNNESSSVTCKYNIIYTPTATFINSTNNTSNTLEFELIGTNDITSDKFNLNLHNVSTAQTVLSNVSITAAAGTETKHTWSFSLKHYNLSVNQDNLMGKTFGGKVTFQPLDCS